MLQHAGTFKVTFLVSAGVGLFYPLAFLSLAFINMNDWKSSSTEIWLNTNYQLRRNFMYILSGCFSAITIANRYHLKLKPWAGRYIVSFWFLYIFITCLASFEDGNLSLPHWVEIALVVLLILYALIRIPLFFMVLSKETNFWRGGDGVSSIEDSAIGEIQKLLDENRSILIDYMKLSFRKEHSSKKEDARVDTVTRTRTQNRRRVLGTGATAKVVAAVYKPDRKDAEMRSDLGKKRIGVAVKVFTPESITASLLRVFAKEIDLMRKLNHRTCSVFNAILSFIFCFTHIHTHTHFSPCRSMPRTFSDASKYLRSAALLYWRYIEIVVGNTNYTTQQSWLFNFEK